MHYLLTCTVFITILIAISARSTPPSRSLVNNHYLCPEEYRELRRRSDDASSELDDDDDDESRESVCEQAMDMIVKHRNIAKLNPSILLTYCPHYDERLALVQENNKTLCENKKRELNMQRQLLERKRYDTPSDSDDGDDDKRRALRRRELEKQFALRFIRRQKS